MQSRLCCLFLLVAVFATGPAAAETIQARCKVERTVDLKAQPNKIEKRSESLRANADFDWVFAYDLELRRLCKVGAGGICMMTSNDLATTPNGNLEGSTAEFSSEQTGNLILSPSSGRWIYQSDLKQTAGKAGDCAFSAANTQQIALVTRDPTRDIDVLCAGRLTAEAKILEGISQDPSGGQLYREGKLAEAQNVMRFANVLLERTNNRGYERDTPNIAALAEAQSYLQRTPSQRQKDFSLCEAHITALSR